MRSPTARTVASTCAAVVPRSQSYTLSNTTSKRRPERASRSESASLRSAMIFSTRRPSSCFGLRCRTATSWPPFCNSSTSNLPMKRVPPITNTFIRAPDRLIVVFQAQVRDQILAPHPAQGVLELHKLDEDIVLRVNLGRVHRPLE